MIDHPTLRSASLLRPQWTTLLFLLTVLARTLGGSVTGRDFDSAANSLTPRLFRQIMALEFSLL
jgi:hypothetical protein